MAQPRVATLADIASRRAALERKLQKQHEVMRDCDAWHNMDVERLRDIIWRNVPENVKRHTVISPVPMAVKNTCVAFTASKQPKITAIAVNTLDANGLRAANFNERVGYAILHTLNRYRQHKIETETSEYAYGRSVIIGKLCWLTPEQRGEKRRERPVTLSVPFTTPEPPEGMSVDAEDPDVLYEVVEHGDFPILAQLYDPLDCLWSIGRDGGTREFMHISRMTWDEILDLYPDITSKEGFTGRDGIAALDAEVEIIDYWDDENNAIVIDAKWYKKPTKHNYPYCPVIVELANVGPVRDGDGIGARKQYVARPVTWAMLRAAADQSWSDSMTGTYVEAGIFQSFKHTGIDPANSPHMQVVGDGEQPEYVAEFDFGPNKVNPVYFNEDLRPIEQPHINNQLMQFQQTMDSYMAMSGFHPNFLTGVTPAGPDSGYGIVQQRIATTAKMTTTTIAIDRFLSRFLTLAKDLIVAEWEHDDVALMLSDMMGEGRRATESYVEISKETFSLVREIRVEVTPEVPLNDESEKQGIFHANSQYLMSDYKAIDQLGYADDPEEEQMRIAAERVAKEDPLFGPPIRLAMAARWYTLNGMDDQAAIIHQASVQLAQTALAQISAPPQQTPPSQPPIPGGMVPSAMPPPGADPTMLGAMAGPPMPGMSGPSLGPMDAMGGMGGMPMEQQPQMDPAMLEMLMAQLQQQGVR